MFAIMGEIILWVVVVISFILAVLVFINGGLSRRSISYALLMLAGCIWAIFNLLAIWFNDVMPDYKFQFDVGVIAITALLCFSTFMLALSFIRLSKKQFALISIASLIPALILQLFMIDPLFIYTGYIFDDDNMLRLTFNPFGMAVQIIFVLVYAALTVWLYIIALKQARTSIGKQLIRITMIGFIIGYSFGLIFNVALAEVHDFHWVAPACILILAITSYKAVIKHGEDEL